MRGLFFPMPDNYQPDYNNVGGSIPPRPPLSRGQKIAVGVLAVFAVLVIGLWFVQFKKSIINPLRPGAETQNITSLQDENSDEALKNKDTDSDGLSDWDELNLYKTSPYLEDSDSDGFLDKEEIDAGKDPNCPAGRDCYAVSSEESAGVVPDGGAANSESNNLLNQLNLNTGGVSTNEQNLQNVLGGGSDAATLRKMLLDAGMDKAMLDKISDDDLLKSYQETLNSNTQ